MFKLGAIGTIIAAICCFTPALVALLAAVGLSSVIGFLDIILFPALILCLAIMFIAYRKLKKKDSTNESQ